MISTSNLIPLHCCFQNSELITTPSKQIDYDRLAEKAGYKNGSSARACFQDIKKKLRASGNDIDGDNGKSKLL